MIIYKDIITNDELFTDVNKTNLLEDCIYEVECHYVSRKSGDVQIDGANPSAEGEDADEGVDDGQTQSGIDLVLNQGLIKTDFDRRTYMLHLKSYFKGLYNKWIEQGVDEATIKEYNGKLAKGAKIMLNQAREAEFYMGTSSNVDGMVPLLIYRDKPDGLGEESLMLFFKHGLEAEKV